MLINSENNSHNNNIVHNVDNVKYTVLPTSRLFHYSISDDLVSSSRTWLQKTRKSSRRLPSSKWKESKLGTLANDASSCLTFNKAHCESNQKLRETWPSVEVSDYARHTKDISRFLFSAGILSSPSLFSPPPPPTLALIYLFTRSTSAK